MKEGAICKMQNKANLNKYLISGGTYKDVLSLSEELPCGWFLQNKPNRQAQPVVPAQALSPRTPIRGGIQFVQNKAKVLHFKSKNKHCQKNKAKLPQRVIPAKAGIQDFILSKQSQFPRFQTNNRGCQKNKAKMETATMKIQNEPKYQIFPMAFIHKVI